MNLSNLWQKIGMGAGSVATILSVAQQAGYLALLPPQAAAIVGAAGVIVGGVSALYHAAPGTVSAPAAK